MTLPKPAPVTDCCGALIRTWHSQGDSRADEGFCLECNEELCSHCAAVWEVDGGYGDDGTQVRTFALCKTCRDEREALDRLETEWREPR
jgi:hypothetical protein